MMHLNFFKVAALLLLLIGTIVGAEDAPLLAVTPPVRANCEIRMLEPSQAGSVYLSTFTADKEACLKLEDGKTKAVFNNASNRLKRRASGPQED